MIPKILSFLDVETTGTSPTNDRIIDIGIVRVEDGKIVGTLDSLIDPQEHLPPEITRITGINSSLLSNAPTFRDKLEEINYLLSDSVIVAHNSRFDTGFLKSEYKRMGEKFSAKQICTLKLSRRLFPRYKRHNLDSIVDRFGLFCEPRHRAFPDAKVLWDFFQIITKTLNLEKVEKAISEQLKRPSLPKGLPEKVLDSLPESPGVYIFYGDGGSTLYIGKSVNIRDRVMSHFYESQNSAKEFNLSDQVTHIEAIATAGELEALLTEKRLISAEKPLFNRQLRNMENMAIALLNNKNGYNTVSVVESSVITPEDLPNIVAIYRTKGKAKKSLISLSKTHKLCNILLGLEKGERCFGFQIETCNGACAGEEPNFIYNTRFAEAFSKTKIKVWPFSGAVLIPEGEKAHLINKWCYLGMVSPEDSDNIEDLVSHSQFDWDTYKILSSYLLKPGTSNKIKILN